METKLAIYVNEQLLHVSVGTTVWQIREQIKKDADVVVHNGYAPAADVPVRGGDRLVFIKKGEVPTQAELEAALYARHSPGVQAKIKKICVAIAGLGGLGSNVAIALARLGMGKLLLIDYDVVEPSNLNRQQYFVQQLGMYKTEAMRDLLVGINPFIELETRNIYLDSGNAAACLQKADIIVEALDQAASKALLVNTVLTELKGKPIVAASGLAGYYSSNLIQTEQVTENLYVVGDGFSAARSGCGLMAPRVAIAAHHQANMVLRLILGERET